MATGKEFAEYLHEVFAQFGPIQTRRMFGGHGVYHEGLMFGLVADSALYLKADAQTTGQFTERGLQPFQYEKGGKAMTIAYYQAPEEVFDDPDEAAVWARLAFEAALRASRAKQAKSPARTPRKKTTPGRKPRR
ncbi:MAG: TfoX/Sxy family protein [Gammaproteobacteria bacterium]|nr:TfoX/Sxy family protein [Gammaproteobacteria bacterium]